jgi:DNA polymerase III epsilon subunit family exonuclease
MQLPLSPEPRTVCLRLRADDADVAALVEEVRTLLLARDPRGSVRVVDPLREQPWTELSFVAVDVETTGFIAGRDRVIEVAWVRFERGREVERFSSLLCVDVDIPEPVRRLTGIHKGMLADKPRFVDVAPGLVDALASADFVVAYNAPFDRGFLSTELRAAGRELPDGPWVDPLAFLRELEDKSVPKRLCDAARRFGVENPGAHRAENDARATGELLLRLAPRLPARTLQELLDKQGRWSRLTAASELSLPPEPAPEPAGLGARLLSLFR